MRSVKVAIGVLWGWFKKVPLVGGQSHRKDVVGGPDRLPHAVMVGRDVVTQFINDGVAAKEGQILGHAPRGDIQVPRSVEKGVNETPGIRLIPGPQMSGDVVLLRRELEEGPDKPLDLDMADGGGEPGLERGWGEKFGDAVQFVDSHDSPLPCGWREEELLLVDVEGQTPCANAELMNRLVVVGQVTGECREGSKRFDRCETQCERHDDASTFKKQVNA